MSSRDQAVTGSLVLGLQEQDIVTIFPLLYKLRETNSGMYARKPGDFLAEPSPSSHFFLKTHHHAVHIDFTHPYYDEYVLINRVMVQCSLCYFSPVRS